MKITEFEAIEIGLHKHVKATLDAPLVGLLGKNGSGKSTLLALLGFLFTGDMPGEDAQETFVRYWGREGAATNGSGRAKFIQHGQEGEIFRQVGKSPKRWLKWGVGPNPDKPGSPYTKAADVERVLTEILGSNRKAMTQAIFIPQGELDKLFFGTDGEREAMFVKLLQLGHMEKIEKMIADKINFVSAGYQDLSLLVDDIGAQRNAIETSLAELEKELGTTRDWAADLEKFRDYLSLVRQSDEALASVEFYTNQLHSSESKLREVLSSSPVRIAGLPAVSSLEASSQISLKRSRCDEIRARRDVILAAQTLLNDWQGLEDRLQDNTTKRDKLQADYQGLEALASQDRATLIAGIAAIDSWDSAEASARAALADANAASAAVVQFDSVNAAVDQTAIDSLEQKIVWQLDAVTRATLKVATWTAVAGSATTCCPVCESDFNTATISPEKLKTAKEDLAQLQEKLRASKQELLELQKTQKNYNTRRAELFGAWNDAVAKAKRDENNRPRPTGDRAELFEKSNTILGAQNQRAAMERPLADLNAEIDSITQQLQKTTPAQLAAAAKDLRPEELQDLAFQLDEAERDIKGLESLIALCRPAEDAVVSNQQLIAAAEAKHKALLPQAQEAAAGFSDTLKGLLSEQTSTEQAEETLKNKVGVRQELAGRVRQAQEQADEIRRKQDTLADKVAADAQRMTLKAELVTLKNTFARAGLPMRYVRYRFEQLAEVTRTGLMELDADFTVQVDPTRSVSLTFTRLNEAEPYTMLQSKLSGGQKVRLSTAFLLAVQKLLVPEVAFLVLDEPSLHLDADGKESLKDMLIGISGRLGNTQSQIWICDHAPELESAFGNIIRV
jgi:DNA repair protein SbcC/Rad50